jgi:two-component system, NarL family, nitrate/nitrite response regulator NarL
MTQPTARKSTRILIVEDHDLFAESMELALSLEGYDVRRLTNSDIDVSPALILSQVARLRPRIVLLDLHLVRFGDSVRLIRPIAQSGANVVVVTAASDRARWGECIHSGARKVLSKCGPLNETLSTVRKISQGLPVMGAEEREDLLQLWHRQRQDQEVQRSRLDSLTKRESEVLRQLMVGHPVREIARLSVVSEATVRTQVKSILAKLQVSSQLAAVGLAHYVGWQAAEGASPNG